MSGSAPFNQYPRLGGLGMRRLLATIGLLLFCGAAVADDTADPALVAFLKARAAARAAASQQAPTDPAIVDAIRKAAASRAAPPEQKTTTVRTKQVAQGWHIHQCDRCGYQWSHNDNNVGNRDAHMCPVDGSGPYWMPVQRNVKFVDKVVPVTSPTTTTPAIPSTPKVPAPKISYVPSVSSFMSTTGQDCPT